MKVIILGSGYRGVNVAKFFCEQQDDVTLITDILDPVNEVAMQLDLALINGKHCSPEILYQADAENADLLIAVTQEDEKNILSCYIAKQLFNIPITISLIEDPSFVGLNNELLNTKIVDHIININKHITEQINLYILAHSLKYHQLYCNKDYVLVKIKDKEDNVNYGNITTEDNKLFKLIYIDSETNDKIYLISLQYFSNFILKHDGKKIIITGNDPLSIFLAENILPENKVKLITSYPIDTLNHHLDNVIVINSNNTNSELLIDEHIGDCDFFCAVDTEQNDNLVLSIIAKKLGAKNTISIVNEDRHAESFGDKVDLILTINQIVKKEIYSTFSKKVIENTGIEINNIAIHEIKIAEQNQIEDLNKIIDKIHFFCIIKPKSLVTEVITNDDISVLPEILEIDDILVLGTKKELIN